MDHEEEFHVLGCNMWFLVLHPALKRCQVEIRAHIWAPHGQIRHIWLGEDRMLLERVMAV